VQSICALAGAAVSFFFARSYLFIDTKIDWTWVTKLFHYGKYVFGTNISSSFFKTSDQMILGWLLGPIAVGGYNAAARVSNFFEVPVTSIAAIVFPQSARRIHEQGPSAAKHLYEKSVAVMLAIILPAILFVVLFPKFVLLVLADRKYLSVALVLQLIVLQSLFLPFLRQFGTILDSVGKPHINFYFILANALLNIIVNYFMIKLFGLEGAAFGSLAVYIICTGFVGYYMKMHYHISFGKTIRNTLEFYPEIAQTLQTKLLKR